MPDEQENLDRRGAPRRAVQGTVRLRPDNPFAAAITADLVDSSVSGFRARHNCPTLTTGQAVWFDVEEAQGRARVVWTRILGSDIESGFAFILQD